MSECLLVIIATPAVEEAVVDWLLARKEIGGFSSHRIDGHSVAHQHLSLAEQVTGRERKIMFEIQAPLETARRIIEEIRRDLAGCRLHYWVVPVIESGRMA